MSSAVLRLKRKASCEPLESFVIDLKKSKIEKSTKCKEVLFKFAATLKSDKDSVKEHIKAAINKDTEDIYKWRSPKSMAISKRNTYTILGKQKKEKKIASEKNRLDLLNNRRLIFTETVPIPIEDSDEDECAQNAEVRELFQLYDIIEENEEPKKQKEDNISTITCNGEPLIPEKNEFVYDVYIADGVVEESFADNAISLRPCTLINEDIYSGDSENSSQNYEDEDDSNDENNWRNEYPEDEDSHPDNSSDDYDPDYYCEEKHSHLNLSNLASNYDPDYYCEEKDHHLNLSNLDIKGSSDEDFDSNIDDSPPHYYEYND